jgi:DNA-binding transcriptional LysR family regulator
MLQNVRNIQILEKRMNSDLKDMAHGEVGKFTLGISTSRAPVVLPAVLSHYHEAFPKVKISFCIEDTQVLEERMLRGDIDLFIGVNTDPNPEFCIQTIALDEIVLVISSELLHSYFRVEEIKMMQNGVDMEKFCDVRVIQEYLNDRKLQLKVMYNISDSETQILLCAEGICASLCPKMLLTTAYRHNLTCSENKKLYMLPINHLDRKLHIDLVTHSHMSQPMYVRVFIETLRKEVAEISKRNFLAIGQD